MGFPYVVNAIEILPSESPRHSLHTRRVQPRTEPPRPITATSRHPDSLTRRVN